MEPKKILYNTDENPLGLELLGHNWSGALDQVYFFYFRRLEEGESGQVVVGFTDLVLDMWGLKPSPEADPEKDLWDFCSQVLPLVLDSAREKNRDVRVLLVHRDDNIKKQEGYVYYKAGRTAKQTSRKILFPSEIPSNTVIRRKILKVCYAKYQEDPHNRVNRSELLSRIPVSENELERNLKYLIEKGFVQGNLTSGGFMNVILTAKGVDTYEDPERFDETFSLKVEQQTINVGGDIVSTTVRGNNNNVIVKSQIKDAFKMLKQDVKNSEEDKKEEAVLLLERLEKEMTKKSPDRSKLRELLSKTAKLGGWLNDKILSHPVIAQIIAELFMAKISGSSL